MAATKHRTDSDRGEAQAQKGEASRERPIAVYGAIVANLAIAAAKFTAAAFTGSSAMLSEGFHSVVDTGNQLLLLLGDHRSRKKPDARHPFGYGKEIYFWSLIVAMLLFGLGGGLSIYEGVHRLQHPTPLKDPTWNYAVLAFALLAEGVSWTIAVRKLLKGREPGESLIAAFRGSKDPSIFVVIGEDTAAIAGVVAALAGVALSHLLSAPWIDAAAAVLIGMILILVALILIIESRALILGERADRAVIDKVRAIALENPLVADCGPIISMQIGPKSVLTAFRVAPDETASADQVVALSGEIEKAVKAACETVSQVFVALDPALKAPVRTSA